MDCIQIDYVRTDNEGKEWYRVAIVSPTEPASLTFNGSAVDNMPDKTYIAAGSTLITPTANYIAFEDGVFTAKGSGGGGGGGVLPIEKCTITFGNIYVEGEPIAYTVTGCEITFNLSSEIYYFSGATATYDAEAGTYNNSKVEIIIPTDHTQSTEIIAIIFFTDNGVYIWDSNISPIGSGSATYDNSTIYITGDCTLNPDTYLD